MSGTEVPAEGVKRLVEKPKMSFAFMLLLFKEICLDYRKVLAPLLLAPVNLFLLILCAVLDIIPYITEAITKIFKGSYKDLKDNNIDCYAALPYFITVIVIFILATPFWILNTPFIIFGFSGYLIYYGTADIDFLTRVDDQLLFEPVINIIKRIKRLRWSNIALVIANFIIVIALLIAIIIIFIILSVYGLFRGFILSFFIVTITCRWQIQQHIEDKSYSKIFPFVIIFFLHVIILVPFIPLIIAHRCCCYGKSSPNMRESTPVYDPSV